MEDQNLSYFDAEAYTSDSQDIAIFINEALQSNDANHIANALGIAARGRGIKEVALLSNLSESQLEQSLNQEGNPTLDTLIKTLKALNLKIAVEPIC
ncbi:addiction module antidote protein [Anaerobiospirillum succiniciproducens]|uniref:addiction module antidote protein n=1 Tax=Anaerobiospirillum succiniciproducens TaxID=13335 RepID=UPI002353B7AA|nr:addiction module antidote protein [Anaerobiospirillum succiniciproducens]MCI6863583.1 putative addiction module antidote protein [Anaerobiospirillum succiniciproducens]MDO4675176.1 putative addiction module antidote protein [Anaerobiospirillum succiniciproducens]